jgi:hypothetical protein
VIQVSDVAQGPLVFIQVFVVLNDVSEIQMYMFVDLYISLGTM